MYYINYASPVGDLLLTCGETALTGIWIDKAPIEGAEAKEDHPILLKTRHWLDDYFRGTAAVPDIPLCLDGTDFQKKVWEILLTIPYGKTRSYGSIAREMAELLGKEKMSAQAVGQAVGKNPVSILAPCHRVVGAQGQLTGYASGLEKKVWLLRHEGWPKGEAK